MSTFYYTTEEGALSWVQIDAEGVTLPEFPPRTPTTTVTFTHRMGSVTRAVHAVKVPGGSSWDSYNGWREEGSRCEAGIKEEAEQLWSDKDEIKEEAEQLWSDKDEITLIEQAKTSFGLGFQAGVRYARGDAV